MTRWQTYLCVAGAGAASILVQAAAEPASAQASAKPASPRPVLEDPTGLPPPKDPPGLPPPKPGEGQAKATGFSYFPNRDMSADSFRRTESATQARCELACRRDASCLAYSFDRWNRACFLKSEAGELLVNARSISATLQGGPKPPESGLPTYVEYFNGKAFAPTGYLSRPSSNRDQCEALCVADGACIAFTLLLSRRECRLYEQGNEYFRKAGSMSCAKRQ